MAEHVVEIEIPGFDPEPNVAEPVVVQAERACYLIYWDREFVRRALRFTQCSISKFGYPNDDGRYGHRLYSKGLRSYGVFEVLESQWLLELREANAVFEELASISSKYVLMEGGRHLIISFHDSTLECIATDVHMASEFPQLDSKLLNLSESL